jgi:hypothetical protein
VISQTSAFAGPDIFTDSGQRVKKFQNALLIPVEDTVLIFIEGEYDGLVGIFGGCIFQILFQFFVSFRNLGAFQIGNFTDFPVRIVGKYIGAWTGCQLVGKGPKVRNFLGLALIPQAGVAIGLAALGARALGGDTGHALETIILSSSVLYELIGPGAAKLSLWLSGSYSNDLETVAPVPETTETGEKKSELELLIERIRKIQDELPEHTENENERAFTEAAEEYYREQTQARNLRPRRPGIRRGPF